MLTKMTFLGAGSAFSHDHGQCNVELDIECGTEKHRMLIDCGSQWHNMVKDVKGISVMEYLHSVNSIFLTHNHGDHNHGLEEVGFLSRFVPTIEPKKLYGDKAVLKELWDEVLKGNMACLDYGQLTEEEENHPVGLETYYKPEYMAHNDNIKIGATLIEPFSTIHVTDRMGTKDSCGLFITTFSGRRIMYTSDTQFAPRQLEQKYHKADSIFHDCETSPFPSGVHAHYNDLKTLPDATKAKIWLMHYQDGDKPDCVADGFAGWVTQGQSFDFV